MMAGDRGLFSRHWPLSTMPAAAEQDTSTKHTSTHRARDTQLPTSGRFYKRSSTQHLACEQSGGFTGSSQGSRSQLSLARRAPLVPG